MFGLSVAPGVELRLAEESDAEALHAIIAAERQRLGEWLPWVDRSTTAAHERDYIRAVRASLGTDLPSYVGVVVVDGVVAGTAGLKLIGNRSGEIGYWLSRGFEGRGVMTRTAAAVTGAAFDRLSLHRVVIRAATGNRRSRAVPERLGFRHEGTSRAAEWVRGRALDIENYAVLAPEWPRA